MKKTLITSLLLFFVISAGSLAVLALKWDHQIQQSLKRGWLEPPVQFYAEDLSQKETFLFAQYEKGRPLLKYTKPLEEFALECRWAVLVAEDQGFITHKGISLKGILRAVWKNLKAWRMAEGASTITQQLVKNLFLSPKKTLWRKFKEQIMAGLIEVRLSKDEILNLYLNIIYMGQAGAFQVRGLESAALHYTGKSAKDLNLSECALLAGIIKSPGRYNPFKKPDRALNRRNHILNTMKEKNFINEAEWKKARALKIPSTKPLSRHFIYFTEAVYKKLAEKNISLNQGLKVFTSLDSEFQLKAGEAVEQSLKNLSKTMPNKEAEELLQTALMSVDVETGGVKALIGGRDFKASQFNRALMAKRQIGSLIKPFVVLNALIQTPDLNPLSDVLDKKFTYTYGRLKQKWSPKNYKNQYAGETTLYKALALSLNAGIARLGLEYDMKSLTALIKQAGGPELKNTHPSLLLGALELSPWEVSEIYLALAGLGKSPNLHIIKEVQNLKGEVLYQKPSLALEPALDPKKTAVLIGMLKRVIKNGTGRSLKNFPLNLAGKTGTTNDTLDAWFAGFSPEILTVVWLGFDEGQTLGLTGAGGAIPIWKNFMTKILPNLSVKDFHWPKGVKEKFVKPDEIDFKEEDILPVKKDSQAVDPILLIFEN